MFFTQLHFQDMTLEISVELYASLLAVQHTKFHPHDDILI
jgi:hypothetical protein